MRERSPIKIDNSDLSASTLRTLHIPIKNPISNHLSGAYDLHYSVIGERSLKAVIIYLHDGSSQLDHK